MARCTDTFIIRVMGSTVICSLAVAPVQKVLPNATTAYGHGDIRLQTGRTISRNIVRLRFTYTRGNDGNPDADDVGFIHNFDDIDWPEDSGITVYGFGFGNRPPPEWRPAVPDLSGSAQEVKAGALHFIVDIPEDYVEPVALQRTIIIGLNNGTPD